jgi:membrane associated rhomboid family serine protease
MIPLRDVIPSRSTPYITVTLIALNAVAWLYELTLPGDLLPVFLQLYGVVPADFSTPTLVSSMFLHGSWTHFIGNMWYLWIFGDNVEDRVGRGRFVAFYLICGALAALCQALPDLRSTVPMVGASGAVSGVLGAYVVLYPRAHVLLPMPFVLARVPALVMLGFWFAGQLARSMLIEPGAVGVAFAAHVGGFVGGAILVRWFLRERRKRSN